MNKQKPFVLATVLALIAGTAVVLAYYRDHQRLGQPGISTHPLPGGGKAEVLLPEHVLDYASQVLPEDPLTLSALPMDTSFGQRGYTSTNGTWFNLHAVLMGADRTSLHKPQICMPGQGIVIDKTEVVQVPIARPYPYEMPVIKLSFSKADPRVSGGMIHGIFIYWYVTDGAQSADASALRRMWLSSKHLLQTGELQRWAYIVCYTTYPPGGEAACFDRCKRFLADAVPQFQPAPNPGNPARTMAAGR